MLLGSSFWNHYQELVDGPWGTQSDPRIPKDKGAEQRYWTSEEFGAADAVLEDAMIVESRGVLNICSMPLTVQEC